MCIKLVIGGASCPCAIHTRSVRSQACCADHTNTANTLAGWYDRAAGSGFVEWLQGRRPGVQLGWVLGGGGGGGA
jgi:hypothetical protein